jgi:predicted dehydrogenase
MKKSSISRRNFLGKAALASAAGAIAPAIISGCSRGPASFRPVPEGAWLDQAPDGSVLKAGLIGCGGRGTGAAQNFLDAGPNLQITALGDTFRDKVMSTRETLIKNKQQEVAEDKCFVGFDAFQKVIESDVDVIILATPPFFRPEHLAAAVANRKHIFAEKPVCVDPSGARSVMATALKAKELGLSIVTGTQRRHQRDYVAAYQQVQAGAIGHITGGNVYWNQSRLWHRDPNAEWTEMEWMIRNWVNWTWLSGDHIVEQHVHNIDIMNWFTNSHPAMATGFGSRLRRYTGDQFDNFSVDYVFENGMHFHSMCRQINGCSNNVAEMVFGSEGYVHTSDRNICAIYGTDNQLKWEYGGYVPDKEGKPTHNPKVSPSVQEHIDLVNAIRSNTPFNELENTAVSTLTAIMGRVSAYTGKSVTWEEMMNSDMKLGPKIFELGPVDIPKEVPVAGEAYIPEA